MATHNLSNQDAVLKDYYTDDKIKEQSYGENPFFAMVRKERGVMAGGRRYVQPVEFAHPGGSSSDYAKAMANATTSSYEDFLIQRQKQYQRVLVQHELLFATQSQRDSFQKALDEFDRGFRGLGEKIGRRAYRTQGGSIGRMANTAVTTTVITLADKASAFNFHQGQVLQFAAADGTGALRDSGDTTVVTEIDIEGGTITVADQLDTKITGIQATDYVFVDGDFGQCLSGLEDWLPVDNRAAKLAAAFHGVVRKPAADYLGGIYMDGTTMGGLDEVIIKLTGKVGKYGGRTSHIFANPESLSDMQLLTNSKLQAEAIRSVMRGEDGEVLVGFSGFRAVVGGRTVRIYGDRNCPSNRIYALQLDTWTLWHSGKLVNWLGEDYTGSKLKQAENEDSAEARLGNYCNVGCSAPGWNGVAKINPSA
ncbi:MAG: hypothetical protein ACTHU0_19165 [Kofleriaceae bacterium]